MEAFVLIPEEFSLEFASGTGNNLRVVSNQSFIPRGSKFSPFQGTLRTDEKLRHSNYFRDDNSKGNLKKYSSWGGVRATSWIRFLKKSVQITRDVNLVEVVLPGGQVIYEVRRPISLWEELIVFSTEPPLTFTKALTDAIFDETLKALLLEVPLDLSTSLFHKLPNSSDGESDESCISPNLSIENLSTKSSSSSSSTTKRTRSLLPCSVCAKAFDRPSLLKRHMRTHTGEKPHECDICGKGFSTSSSLNTHRRIHSGEKPHECPTCGKRFTASSNLYYHRMTHVKEKPHKCSICNKSFPTPGDLKSHGYVHSGTWPFRCPVCKRGFSKHTNLKNHLFLHTGSKPHSCTVCNKRFALACNLRAHLKTHHEDQDDTEDPRNNCLVEDEDSEEMMITNISLDEEDCEQDHEEEEITGGLSSP